jgi:hypothetical protein
MGWRTETGRRDVGQMTDDGKLPVSLSPFCEFNKKKTIVG